MVQLATNKIQITRQLIKTLVQINRFNNTRSGYHRQSKKIVDKLVAPFDIKDDPSVPYNIKAKMQWYMAECIYTCEMLNKLIGRRSANKERERYLMGGALVTMCDMIIDDVDLDMHHINKLKKPDTNYSPRSKTEQIYLVCYKAFIDSLQPEVKTEAIRYYELLFDAQVKSKKQFNSTTPKNEVDEICKEKCGYCLLFLRALLPDKITEQEEKAWYELGGFIQYCNDAQDMHKDLQKQMRTFATVRSGINEMIVDLDKQKVIAFSLVKALGFNEKRKDDFMFTLHIMHMGILAKLNAYHLLCEEGFSFDQFSAIETDKVRANVKAYRLFKYGLPKVYSYNYHTVELPLPIRVS